MIKDDGPRLDLLNHLAQLPGNPDGLEREAAGGSDAAGNIQETGRWERKPNVEPLDEAVR